uniref:sodium/calcium exchanger 3-like n=1 Tax=Styela clava TaxID=7725 RepID=UPI001939302C|nr:sodium/calcium exchanger 3-like [Styela clava]
MSNVTSSSIMDNVTTPSSCAMFLDYDCNNGIILPLVNESQWSTGFRACLYLIGLLWSFMFVAIIADTFMCAIEVITSKTTEIKVARPDKEEGYEIIEVRVWNDTVANLTLMALGSSAPEILLSIIEITTNNFRAGELGPSTIVGSAAFNLLIIIGVCIVGIPEGEKRTIKRYKVFATTSLFAIFAYVWLYLVLVPITKNEVHLWEAVATFAFFPILVIFAFIADKDYCGKKKVKGSTIEIEMGDVEDSALMNVTESQEEKLKGVVSAFMQNLDKPENISEEDAALIAVHKIQKDVPHSRAWYRVKASRDMLAGKRVDPSLGNTLERLSESSPDKLKHKVEVNQILGKTQSEEAIVEFDAVSCSVLENCGSVKLSVVRSGNTASKVSVRYETVDGTANAGEDYTPIKGEMTFYPQEVRKYVEVYIVDDDVWEPDETFFVRLYLDVEDMNGEKIKLGRKNINLVTIINDDEPGTVEFTKPSYLVKESVGTAQIPLHRFDGADGIVTVTWTTENITAKEGADFIGHEGKITFEHGEDTKNIEVPIVNDHKTEKDESFQIILRSISEGAKLGHTQKTVVTIVGDEEFDGLIKRVIAKTHLKLKKMKLGSQSWADQFAEAMNVNGGDIENATAGDYVMHLLTFGFKFICAFVPPPSVGGGYPCFLCALVVIAILTALIQDLASIFGCLISLKPSVTAITFVALGTSLPDLFASKTAAIQEKYADNSIGNVTGSNSVNVFLGLGLPWLIAAIYWKVKYNSPFPIESGNLGFSIAIYSICAVLCTLTLIIRRLTSCSGKTELGGPMPARYISALFFFTLWLTYIMLSALQAYDIIPGF